MDSVRTHARARALGATFFCLRVFFFVRCCFLLPLMPRPRPLFVTGLVGSLGKFPALVRTEYAYEYYYIACALFCPSTARHRRCDDTSMSLGQSGEFRRKK